MRLVIFIFFLSTQLFAQDYSGDWVGTIHKRDNEQPYNYSITVIQEDSYVYGESFVSYRDTTWNARKKWNGYTGKNRLQIIESTFITHNHDLGAYWLMIRGVLKYDPKKDKLFGWVHAYDPYTKSVLRNHDYIELYRKKAKLATYEKINFYPFSCMQHTIESPTITAKR